MLKKLNSSLAIVSMLCVLPCAAQTSPDTPKDAATQLPKALSELVKTAYICQGVVGDDILKQARGLAHDELIKLGLDDYNTTMLITTSEGAADQVCDDVDTCWKVMPGLSAAATEADGQTVCNARLGEEIALIQKLNRALGL